MLGRTLLWQMLKPLVFDVNLPDVNSLLFMFKADIIVVVITTLKLMLAMMSWCM